MNFQIIILLDFFLVVHFLLFFFLELLIGNNYFSGSLSSNITLLPTQLTQLNISTNLFSGKLPTISFIRLVVDPDTIYVEKLDVSNNFFCYSLPDLSIGSSMALPYLYFISFSNNFFTGQLPTNYSRFQISSDVFFNNNLLSGPLSNVLSLFTFNSMILNLQLRNNQFTGSLLPMNFFSENSQLTLFDISNNCLTGSIPENVCHLNSIETFNLDGSSSSSYCRISLFPKDSFFNSFISEHTLENSIPICLFSLSKIQTLHLSGNGLTGSLPNDLNVSNSLIDLSLSYNVLTGSIPIALQKKSNWQTLDLSYNKLSGTLLSSFFFPTNETSLLSLQLNRLSGKIPSSLISSSSSVTTSLSVLQGNIFYCSSVDRSSTLPSNDQDYNDYSCSSDTALLIIVLWVSVFVIVFLSCLIFLCISPKRSFLLKIHEQFVQVQRWRNSLTSLQLTSSPISTSSPVSTSSPSLTNTLSGSQTTSQQLSLLELTTYFTTIENVVFIMCLYFLLLILPLMTVLKQYYGTYSDQYIWTVGALFVSSEIAGSIMIVIFCFSSFFLFYWIERLSVTNHSLSVNRNDVNKESVVMFESISSQEGSNDPIPWKLLALLYILYFLIFLLDSIVMLLVDAAFVIAVLNVSASQLILIEIIVAIIRVWVNNNFLWNIIPFLSSNLTKLIFFVTKDPFFNSVEETSVKLEQLINKKYFLGILMIINKIFYPILVIMIILPDCFYYAFFEAPTVTSSITYNTCYFYEGGYCYVEDSKETTSSFIPPFTYYYQCSSNLITYYTAVYVWTFFLIGVIIPGLKLLVKYVYDTFNHEEEVFVNSEEGREKVVEKSDHKSLVVFFLQKSSDYFVLNRFKKYVPSPQVEVLPLFSVDRFICQINSYLAFMFCFGLLFPPLGIIAGISILLIINFEYLTLGKLLKETRELGYDWYEKELVKESKGILISLRSIIGWMIFLSCLLFSFFVFDSIGDEVGWKMALIGMIITIVFPVLMINLYWHIPVCCSGSMFVSSLSLREESKNEIELRESSVVVENNRIEVENPIRN
jgi:Leucine-rich repeat (LRR) protein